MWISRHKFLPLLVALAVLLAVPGCGTKKAADSRLLESERRLAGMYDACKTIKVVDAGKALAPIETDGLKDLQSVTMDAALKRSNGMKIPGKWTGASLGPVLATHGVTSPFKELRVVAWDGYVGRVAYDIASKPDTILAYFQDGKAIPKDDGPVRLVVASQDGFYWIRMITSIEVLR